MGVDFSPSSYEEFKARPRQRSPKSLRENSGSAEELSASVSGTSRPTLVSNQSATGTDCHPGLHSSLHDEKAGRRFHGTLLTSRQWEVLRYRSQGLTQSEVAKKVNSTRENVCIIEHRAWLKIDEAKATLAGLQEMAARSQVLIPSGASVYEATAELIQRADLLDVKLLSSSDDILAALRSKCKGKVRGHHLVSDVMAEIKSDGSLSFRSAA